MLQLIAIAGLITIYQTRHNKSQITRNLLLRLMPLTKQGDELVHAVGQGCRDETEAGCVTVDQVGVSARAFKCLLEVTLRPIHSKLKGANAVHRTFD